MLMVFPAETYYDHNDVNLNASFFHHISVEIISKGLFTSSESENLFSLMFAT